MMRDPAVIAENERNIRDMQKSSTLSLCKCTIGTSVILGFALLGCASHRDGSDQKELSPGFNECAATATDPSTCVNLGIKDPGSRPMTQQMCDDAEAGLEFLPLPIWDMAPVAPTALWIDPYQNAVGGDRDTALGWYSYDDNSTPFRVPGRIYEPTTDPVKRCGDDSPNQYYALHLYGGPFQEWGGGFGKSMKCMNTDSTDTNHHPWLNVLNINKYLCGARTQPLAACRSAIKKHADRTDDEKVMIGVCPQRDLNYIRDGKADDTDEPYMTGMGLDLTDHTAHTPAGEDIAVRGWEGIAFWARRSPNSQPGIRVAVADKYTDDDMMYLSQKYSQAMDLTPPLPRYCERNVQCGCTNSKPCTPVQALYLKFDVDGNRVKWAQDPKDTDVNHCKRVMAIDASGRSLINLSGEVVKNDQGQPKTFPDGSKVTPYNGCPSTDGTANGQPWQTDVMEVKTYGFCFDPAVDPTPPPGTRLEKITNRVWQTDIPLGVKAEDFQQTVVSPVNDYNVCGSNIFTSAYPNDSWIRFFCNTHEEAGYFYPFCGATACGLEYPSFQSPDPTSWGRQCNDFSFVGSITRSFCYTPGSDPNPYEATQICGDFWQKPVEIGVDWTFIKVPFSSLLQQGWAKRQYQFDLSSITNIRFQWERGWMDYQISDVRFYRTKQ